MKPAKLENWDWVRWARMKGGKATVCRGQIAKIAGPRAFVETATGMEIVNLVDLIKTGKPA
jgi:hypothetical protein